MPEIYFHVGMGKVASTYLREAFFPKLRNIHYIPRAKRHEAVAIIQENKHACYLVSRALDRNMEEGIRDIALAFPETHPVIIVRSPDSWLVSQYKRHVKNGFPGSLQEFMDVENDLGFWRREELLFSKKIHLLEKSFQPKPMVLLYEDLISTPREFFNQFAQYIRADYTFEDIALAPRHKARDQEGLIFRRKISRKFSDRMPESTRIKFLHWPQRRLRMLSSYVLIWAGKTFPGLVRSDEALVEKEYLEKVKRFASVDWNEVLEYAAQSKLVNLNNG